MPRKITIGALRYDIVADTSKFIKGVRGSAREARQAEKIFKKSLTPMAKLNLEYRKMKEMHDKGYLTKKRYRKEATRLEMEMRKLRHATEMNEAKQRAYNRTMDKGSHAVSRYARAQRGMAGSGGNSMYNIGGSVGSLVGGARFGAAGRLLGGMGGGAMLGGGVLIGGAGLSMKGALTQYAERERMTVDLQSIIGKGPGSEVIGQFKQLAKTSALTMDPLIRGAQTWISYGNAVEQVVPVMKQIGTIAGGDTNRMQQLTVAISQIVSQGKLMAQERNQLVNAGFPIAEIAKEAGVSMTEFKDAIEEGRITSEVVLEAMQSMTSEGGLLANRLEEGAKTISGRLSILASEWKDFQADMGEQLAPEAKATLGATSYVANYWMDVGRSGLGLWGKIRDTAGDVAVGFNKVHFGVNRTQQESAKTKQHWIENARVVKDNADALKKVTEELTEQDKLRQQMREDNDRIMDFRADQLLTREEMLKRVLALELENSKAQRGEFEALKYAGLYQGGDDLLKRYRQAEKEKKGREDRIRRQEAREKAEHDKRKQAIVERGKKEIDLIEKARGNAENRINSFFEAVTAQAGQANPNVDLTSAGADYQYVQQRQQRMRLAKIQERLDKARNQKLEQIRVRAERARTEAENRTNRLITAIEGTGV